MTSTQGVKFLLIAKPNCRSFRTQGAKSQPMESGSLTKPMVNAIDCYGTCVQT